MMRQLVAWLLGDGPTGWMRETKVILAAAWTLGLYKLVRVEEFTATSQGTRDPSADLTRADIALSGKPAAEEQTDATTWMGVHPKASKVGFSGRHAGGTPSCTAVTACGQVVRCPRAAWDSAGRLSGCMGLVQRLPPPCLICT